MYVQRPATMEEPIITANAIFENQANNYWQLKVEFTSEFFKFEWYLHEAYLHTYDELLDMVSGEYANFELEKNEGRGNGETAVIKIRSSLLAGPLKAALDSVIPAGFRFKRE